MKQLINGMCCTARSVCVCVRVQRGKEKDPCRTACSEAEQPCSPCRAGAPGSVSDRFQELDAVPGVACGSSVGPKTNDLTFTGDAG